VVEREGEAVLAFDGFGGHVESEEGGLGSTACTSANSNKGIITSLRAHGSDSKLPAIEPFSRVPQCLVSALHQLVVSWECRGLLGIQDGRRSSQCRAWVANPRSCSLISTPCPRGLTPDLKLPLQCRSVESSGRSGRNVQVHRRLLDRLHLTSPTRILLHWLLD